MPHPLAPRTLRQREIAWYQNFFQFEGIAEAWLQQDDWALLRELLRGDGDLDRYISHLSRTGALTASLNWDRATSRRGCRGFSLSCRWYRLIFIESQYLQSIIEYYVAVY